MEISFLRISFRQSLFSSYYIHDYFHRSPCRAHGQQIPLSILIYSNIFSMQTQAHSAHTVNIKRSIRLLCTRHAQNWCGRGGKFQSGNELNGVSVNRRNFSHQLTHPYHRITVDLLSPGNRNLIYVQHAYRRNVALICQLKRFAIKQHQRSSNVHIGSNWVLLCTFQISHMVLNMKSACRYNECAV